jgi:cellulose biosynthesis protein BcsE
MDLVRSWRRELSNLAGGSQPMPRPAGLGVDDLPHGVGRLPAGTPVALLAQDEACYRDWSTALAADLLDVGPALMLAAQAEDIDALLRVPALRQAHQTGRLRAWLLPHPAQERLRRDGLGELALELKRIGLNKRVSLCLLDANAMLSGVTVAELQRLTSQLRYLSAMRRWPMTLLFPLYRAPGAASAELAAAVRTQTNAFSHVAELGMLSGHPVLTLHRWDSDQGAVFDVRYELRRSRTQDATPGEPQDQMRDAPDRLGYGGSFSWGAEAMLADAPDQFIVHATQAAVGRHHGVPSNWRIVPTLAALQQAASHAVGATVLLDAGAPEQFDAVASLVYQLRQSRPPSLKLIVRETDSKLRANSEQALLRLGATAVVYRELGFSRLLRLIEDHRRQIHPGVLENDYERALTEFLPAAVRGYQSPARFAQLVRDILARTRDAGLGHCLARLQLRPGVAHLDALRACRTQRDGDLVTFDAQGLYVFLFACHEADLDHALPNLFTLPLGQLFASQISDATPGGMALLLEHLSDEAHGLPDDVGLTEFASASPENQSPGASASDSQAPAPLAVRSTTAPAEQRRPEPMQVRPRPIGQRYKEVTA